MISRRLALALLGVAGLGISGYMTVVHYSQGAVPLACAQGATVNCEQVTTSPQSAVGPVPVALLGMAWFAVALALALGKREGYVTPRFVWSLGGLLFVFYLVYAELFLIGAICLWCTAVHAVVIALFLLSLEEFVNRVAPADPIRQRELAGPQPRWLYLASNRGYA